MFKKLQELNKKCKQYEKDISTLKAENKRLEDRYNGCTKYNEHLVKRYNSLNEEKIKLEEKIFNLETNKTRY